MKKVVLLSVALLCAAHAQGAGKHWVTTWTTAQQLVAAGGPPRPARTMGPEASNLPSSLNDQTIRMVAHISTGGRRIRIELSNMPGAPLLEVGSAHVALSKGNGEILANSDRPLQFGGSPSVVIRPGAQVVSDPVDLEAAPLSDVAVSLYFREDTG